MTTKQDKANHCTKVFSRDSWHFHTCKRPAKWLVNGKPRCGIHGKSRTRIAIILLALCCLGASPTPQEQLTRANYLIRTAIDPGDMKAATWHMERAKAACALASKEYQTEKSRLYKKYRARYLRYVRANQQKINRLNRQARGIANTLQSIGNQLGIQSRSNAHFRHDAVFKHHHHP